MAEWAPKPRRGRLDTITARTDAHILARCAGSTSHAASTHSDCRGPNGLVECETFYKNKLHRHLSGSPASEIDFFVNARRFDLMARTLGSELERRPLRILNAACGPFALEFYTHLPGAIIDSFDIDERLIALHHALSASALIAPCRFRTLDVAAFEPTTLYDIVLVNDLFYTKHVLSLIHISEPTRPY